LPPHIPCEFFLIRYVPDVVKGEFTNIGVVLREVGSSAVPRLRFTRDWSRVRCNHTDADINMLEALESEMTDLLQREADGAKTKPILTVLADSLSNSIQISEPRACLAENLTVELIQLMRLHVESLRAPAMRKQSGRNALVTAMRKNFEKAGVWAHMRKRIAASEYTRPGDPLKLDCGYGIEVPEAEREATSREDLIRIFHAVSLEHDAEAAKSLAFSAPLLRQGFILANQGRSQLIGRPWLGLDFDLTAVVEPIRTISAPADDRSDDEEESDSFTGEAADLYRFGVSTMESAGIRVLTLNNLAAAAERARIELRL
jgi:hypothetical protein